MVQTGHNAYRQNAGNTIISKEQLLLKLYAGSLNFLRLAKRGMEEKNPKIKGENISKVLAIMTELDCALDMQTGGEMAENLSTLYRHIMYTLVNANIRDDLDALDEVEKIISEIKEGFEEAVKLNKANPELPSHSHSSAHTEKKEGMRLAI